MRAGHFAEIGPAEEILSQPHRPYTRELLVAVQRTSSRLESGVRNTVFRQGTLAVLKRAGHFRGFNLCGWVRQKVRCS